MPKVVRFSVFFPSLSSSSAVWAHPSPHQEHSNAASIFLMISSFQRAIVCLRAKARNAEWDRRSPFLQHGSAASRYHTNMLRNTADSWGAPAKWFHWVMAALILAQITLGVMAASWRVSPTKLELFFWHKSTGMLILLLVALRLLWRLANPAPALPSGMPAWERAAARSSHLLLYALMIAMPITGWIVNSASNIPFRIFRLIPLPAIVAPDQYTAGSKLEFIATFEKAPVPGVFREFDARLRFDPEKPAGSSLDVTVKVTSADMDIADVNREIRGKDWFDYAAFPQAEFRSTDLRRAQGNRYVARGTLSLKGVKQPVEVPFTWTGSADGATMEGELQLSRGAFGIGAGEWAATDVIGADVHVKFKVKLRKAG